jgi:hypothetical protein
MSIDIFEIVRVLTNHLTNLTLKPALVEVKYKPLQGSIPKNCFNNAFRALSFDSNALYVLGYVFVHNIPIEHCWIKSMDTYYDITFPPGEDHIYISVMELTLNEIFPYVEKNMTSPNLYDLNRFFDKNLK